MLERTWRSIAVAALLLSCSGCSTGREDEQITLTIFGLNLEAGQRLSDGALAEYTRNTGVAVDVVPTLGTSAEQVRVAQRLLRNPATAPDLFIVDVIWLGTLQQDLLDLARYARGELDKHIAETTGGDGTPSRIVALPFYMNAGVLYYRSDLLKKYGYSEAPQTWDELERMALRIQEGERKAKNGGFWGYVWQGAAYEGLTCNALEWQASFGVPCIVDDNGGSCLNSSGVANAFTMASKWVGTISPPGTLSHTEADSLKLFTSGNAAFMRQWTSAFANASSAMRTGTVELAPLPAGPAGRAHTIGGFHIAVSRHSKYPEQAAQLAMHLTSAQVQKERALQRGFVPTQKVLHENAELVNSMIQLRVLQEAGHSTLVRRPRLAGDSRYAEVSKAYYETVHQILSREIDAENGISALHAKLIRLARREATARSE